MNGQLSKLLLSYIYFLTKVSGIMAVSNSLTTTESSIIIMPMSTATHGLVSSKMESTAAIQHTTVTTSATLFSSLNMVSTTQASVATLQPTTAHTPMPSNTMTVILHDEPEASTLTPLTTITTITRSPLPTDGQRQTESPTTVRVPSNPTAPPTTNLETTHIKDGTEIESTTPKLLPGRISTEILSLVAISLSTLSCCCVVLLCLGCILTWSCGKWKSNRAREVQDSTFRSATLQRPLGIAIREMFPIAIENPIAVENPTFSDHSPDMELKDISATNNRPNKKEPAVNRHWT